MAGGNVQTVRTKTDDNSETTHKKPQIISMQSTECISISYTPGPRRWLKIRYIQSGIIDQIQLKRHT